MKKRIVLIEGIGGNLGANLLTPAILKFQHRIINNPNIKFYGTDFSNNVTLKGQQAIKKLTEIGMKYIDKSDWQSIEHYNSLRPDHVYIATPPRMHIKLVLDWLNRAHRPETIAVEKPFTEDISEMQNFIAFFRKNHNLTTKIIPIDHANAFNLNKKNLKRIRNYLGTISSISFFWIQDHSGAHKTDYLLEGGDCRPISRENRLGVALEEKRMVFDALVHFFISAIEVVDLKEVEITDIKASQYERAEISGETFIAVRLLMKDRQDCNNTIVVKLYAGKGVGRIDALNIKKLAHLLIINNSLGDEVRLSLDDNKSFFINSKGLAEESFSLPSIYTNEMHNLFFEKQQEVVGQTPEYALQCLEILDEIRHRVDQYQIHSQLPTYKLGSLTMKRLP